MNLHMHPPGGLGPGNRRSPFFNHVLYLWGGKKTRFLSGTRREADLLDSDYIRIISFMQGVTVNLSVSLPLKAGKTGFCGENMRRLKETAPAWEAEDKENGSYAGGNGMAENAGERRALGKLICAMVIWGSIGVFRRYIAMPSALLACERTLCLPFLGLSRTPLVLILHTSCNPCYLQNGSVVLSCQHPTDLGKQLVQELPS